MQHVPEDPLPYSSDLSRVIAPPITQQADVALRNCVRVEKMDDPTMPIRAILRRVPSEQLMELYGELWHRGRSWLRYGGAVELLRHAAKVEVEQCGNECKRATSVVPAVHAAAVWHSHNLDPTRSAPSLLPNGCCDVIPMPLFRCLRYRLIPERDGVPDAGRHQTGQATQRRRGGPRGSCARGLAGLEPRAHQVLH